MATIVKTPSGTWKAVIRKNGWPTTAKTFRTKRDAEDWARRTEDEMVRGVYLSRAPSEKLTVSAALKRYIVEVSATKKPTTQRSESFSAKHLEAFFRKYSMAAVSAELVAKYRDERLAVGKSNNKVRLELAMLGHLFRVAIQEWGIGLTFNPVANVRKPSPGAGRDRRLSRDEQQRLFAAADAHSNPMLGWIVRLAVEAGMRSSEIAGLCRSQVDLRRRVVTLRDTKNGSSRVVPLTREAAEVLGAALENPIRPIGTDLVFFGEPGRDGTRKPYVFQKLWAGLVGELGMKSFNSMRQSSWCDLLQSAPR
jgi:integrase